MPKAKYKRILLKLSGEALAGDLKTGLDADVMSTICKQIKEVSDLGVEIGIVVGGGNFWRGKYSSKMERTTTDTMGMLATIMNALALQDELEKIGLKARIQTSVEMTQIAEPYTRRKTMDYLKDGKIVIFAGGTGHPYFSTDTAAALRASEVNAEVILVAKTIDGVYSADPKIDPSATKYDEITYVEVLEKNLKVMDQTAISLCRDNNMPLIVFKMNEYGNILKAVTGQKVGTLVTEGK